MKARRRPSVEEYMQELADDMTRGVVEHVLERERWRPDVVMVLVGGAKMGTAVSFLSTPGRVDDEVARAMAPFLDSIDKVVRASANDNALTAEGVKREGNA